MTNLQRMQSRIPKHLHTWLKDRNKKTNRSMNKELVNLLARAKEEDLKKQSKETV